MMRRSRSGLQFKRRFWEQDERDIWRHQLHRPADHPDLAIPAPAIGSPGKGVLLGGYSWATYAYEFTALPPEERVRRAVEYGAQIHPQYKAGVRERHRGRWHRVPWALGCYGMWTEESRARHYDNLCAHRRAHSTGGRACLLHSGLAGGSDPVVARRDLTPPPARRHGLNGPSSKRIQAAASCSIRKD